MRLKKRNTIRREKNIFKAWAYLHNVTFFRFCLCACICVCMWEREREKRQKRENQERIREKKNIKSQEIDAEFPLFFCLDVLDNTPDQNGRTGLMWAAAKGATTLIQIMCRHGSDPNCKVTLKNHLKMNRETNFLNYN